MSKSHNIALMEVSAITQNCNIDEKFGNKHDRILCISTELYVIKIAC